MKGLNDHINEFNLETAYRLIQNGADINEAYGIGIRPIIAAINSGNKRILEFVIGNGADLNIDDGEPLRNAIDITIDGMIQDGLAEPKNENLEIVKILLAGGADLELKNESGKRPVDVITAFSHNQKSFELLKSFFRPLIPNIDELITRN
jgi:ankyrin repeat protein